jgi:hypothetical protein
MRRLLIAAVLLKLTLGAASLEAQTEAPAAAFRKANEKAALSRWDEAIEEYGRLAAEGARAPALYWNWAQAAAASGKKGEAVWALLRAQDLAPHDSSITREMERLRAELGLDPSELSRGFLGDVCSLARRFRFDGLALLVSAVSLLFALRRKPRAALSAALLGLVLIAPFFMVSWRESRGVVVRRDAPLVDVPRQDAVALANLREGEVVPILEEQGDYVKIQDASGARGFARKDDVRRIGVGQ